MRYAWAKFGAAVILGVIFTLMSLSFHVTLAAPFIDCNVYPGGVDTPGALIYRPEPFYEEEGLPFVIRQVPTDPVCDTVHYQWLGLAGDLASWSLLGYLTATVIPLLLERQGLLWDRQNRKRVK